MFPTIDNVKQYLENKQWDRLLKEYNKYKSVIVNSKENNIVIDMVGFSRRSRLLTLFRSRNT